MRRGYDRRPSRKAAARESPHGSAGRRESALESRRDGTLLAHTPKAADRLARGYGQKPDQQSKQNQGADQRKKRVQRMEVEVRIPIEPISCSQHKTSLARVTGAIGRPVSLYFATISLPWLLFFMG